MTQRYFVNAKTFSLKEDAHPLSSQLLLVMKKGDTGEYSKILSKIKLINEKKLRIQRAEENLKKLSKKAPILGEMLRNDLKSEISNERLRL